MHFVVFGVGAVGGFYGTKLANYINNSNNKDLRISFIARGETLNVLKHNGAKLFCKKENFGKMQETIIQVQEINVVDSYSKLDINPNELTIILLCTKSKDTIPVSLAIKRKFNKNTLIISIQNGVDNEDKIASILGKDSVIACLTNVAAETLEPGIYMQKGSYGLVIGELQENADKRIDGKKRTEIIEDVFKNAGIEIKTSKNIEKDQWSKLVWNSSFNPMSVLYEETVGQLLENPEKKNRIESIMKETIQVAKAQGIDIDNDVADKHIERTSALDWYDFRTSMLQDYQKGKVIELNELLGIVIDLGKKLGVKTPSAQKLYDELLSKISSK